jgi:hypothetical protein
MSFFTLRGFAGRCKQSSRVEVARRIKKYDPTKKSVEIIDLKIDKLLSGITTM